MRHKLLVLVALVAMLLLAACEPGPDPTADTGADNGGEAEATEASDGLPTEIGEGEGAVSIVAWAGYIERGDTDPNYDWVTAFEEETGCMVEVKTAATSDEMVTLMNQPGYDLVTASGDASLRLIYGGRIAPINIDLIPSWSTVDERLQEGAWHTVDTDGDGTAEHYGTPYQWGANVLMYNTDTFPEAPTSWNVVFEEQTLPDGESNSGRVQAYDGAIYVADAALYLMAARPELGITDPYELNREQFDAVVELLTAQSEIVPKYWHDVAVQVDDFTNEGFVASSTWPYQVNLLVGAGAPIASTVPAEGATGWADTTMLSVDAEHPNCAYMWMEHSLDPKVQGDLASWFGSVPAVPNGCTSSELLGETGCSTNGFDDFDKIHFWKTPTVNCASQDECVPYEEWVDMYLGIIGGS